jgi:hypothetical protein
MSMIERPGNYWHMLPEFTMARKAIWTAVNSHTGKRRIDEAFPLELRESTNEQEMFIRLKGFGGHSGSTWQCVGSDSVTRGSGIGSSTAGIVFSEFALANPSAWAYYRPILEENNGWACFVSTPRGRNHLLSLYNHARSDPAWFAELLTAEDTGALTPEALAEALREYTALYGADQGRASYLQEYFCDFAASVLGAFFGHEMKAVRDEHRIVEVEALEGQYVHRAWDLGVGLEHYAEVIERREAEHGWKHGHDYVPHDAKVKEFGTGRTRVETMQSMGLHPLLVPMASIQDGINAVRRTLPLCVFHPRTEEVGIAALEQYRREWDDEKKCFRASPLHDWCSDRADAFRYLSQAWRYAPSRPVEDRQPTTGFIIPPPAEPRRGSIQL